MNDAVEEVSEFVRTGGILSWGSPLDELRWTIVSDRQAAQLGDEAWVDLRERMASSVIRRSMRADEKVTLARIAEEYEQVVIRPYRRRHPWLVDDASADLINVAQARLTGEPSPFFEELFEVHKTGGFPCRWEGTYPGGRLVVLVPS